MVACPASLRLHILLIVLNYRRRISLISLYLSPSPVPLRYATILAFDVKIEREAQEMADSLGVKIFQADIIYHLFDKFTAYREELKQKKREEFRSVAVFPCKLRVSIPLTIALSLSLSLSLGHCKDRYAFGLQFLLTFAVLMVPGCGTIFKPKGTKPIKGTLQFHYSNLYNGIEIIHTPTLILKHFLKLV